MQLFDETNFAQIWLFPRRLRDAIEDGDGGAGVAALHLQLPQRRHHPEVQRQPGLILYLTCNFAKSNSNCIETLFLIVCFHVFLKSIFALYRYFCFTNYL
jgi:hypothetical protein